MPHNRRSPSATPRRPVLSGWLALALLVVVDVAHADTVRLLVARTITESGLIGRLVDAYERTYPERQVRVIEAGALEAIERARRGEADALISHAPDSEQLFMADGYGLSRTLILYNQFAIFGPPEDPLGLRRETDLLAALRRIAAAEPAFLVQGRRSGTRYRLSQLWATAHIRPDWIGFETTGGSSQTTLSTAATFGAHAFADMGSYFGLPAEQRKQIVPLVRDHRALRNDYHYLVANPDRLPGTDREAAEQFLAFLVSPRAQQLIAQFGTSDAPAALYTPAAHLDQELQVRRARDQLEAQRQRLYLLGGAAVLAVALSLFAAFLYHRVRGAAQLTMRHAARLERAAAGSQEALYEWDMVAGSLFHTPLMLELLGLTASDARNLHALLRQALDGSEANRVSSALQEYLNEPRSGRFGVELAAAGRRLELRGEAARDSDGNPLRLAGSLRAMLPEARPPTGPDGASLHDPLTGLPARRLLGDRLQHTLQQCGRDHSICLVLVVGLNAVRSAGELSDTPPDDGVIKAVAKRLGHLLRASDTLARMDDDNFVIVLTAADEHHARLAMEKLLAGLQRPFHLNNQTLQLDSAMGGALFPAHGRQHHSLLHRAQLAMLQASRDGRALGIYQPPAGAEDAPD